MNHNIDSSTAVAIQILLVSTSYPRDEADWRGVFIRHMVDAITRSGGVQLSVWAPPGNLPSSVAASATPDEIQWLAQIMAAGGISHLLRQGPIRHLGSAIRLLRMLADAYRRNPAIELYHINWLQCALPLPNNGKPAVITVLGNDLKLLKVPFMRHALRRAIRGRKVAICPNADWMLEPLQSAFGDVADIVPVSFGIDPCWYSIQRDAYSARPLRWLVVTRLTADKLGPLFEWSRAHFDCPERELHLFGPMQERILIPDWVNYHGAATPEKLATEWFPGACGLITLSRHAEGRPQVMLEAMAAGMPILASNMPAHASIVAHGSTGMLCDDLASYSAALHLIEKQETNLQFGTTARQWALREFGTWDDCAGRYTRIYQELLGVTSIE